MRFRSPFSTLALVALAAGCADDLTNPRTEQSPSFVILDGARGGNPHFFFLPPMVPQPSYTGSFDGAQAPTVHICRLENTSCIQAVATFVGSAITVDAQAESYGVDWSTAGLRRGVIYRIEVLVGTTVLGYADAWLTKSGQIRLIENGKFVGVPFGQTLPIRFRIESSTPPPPPPGVWQNGDFVTCSQISWGFGDGCSFNADFLTYHFGAIYFPVGVLEVGIPGSSGFSIQFTAAADVITFLRSGGPPAVLNADLVNPTASAAGTFGVEVVALKLNVDLSDAGPTLGDSGIPLGDLVLCNLTTVPELNGFSVRQFLNHLHNSLGGGLTTIFASIDDLTQIAAQANASFSGGAVSAFALQHLGKTGCQAVAWGDGDFVTYTPADWLRGILSHFGAIYFPVGGVIEVGLPGTVGFSIQFSHAGAVTTYLPALGPAAPLNFDLADPTSTSSGFFGGEVVALKLNIDFSDAGHLPGAAGIPFGDLTLCGLATPSLNGTAVRGFLGLANAVLGDGSVTYTAGELSTLAREINASFSGGIVSQFAQDHLVNGACP